MTLEQSLRRLEHLLRVLSVCVSTLGFAVVVLVIVIAFGVL